MRTELPHTWAAWSTGHVTEWTATVIARETACLPLEHRLTVDETVAADADHLATLGQRELVGRLRAEAERLDPASVVARRRRAESERSVTLRPAPDTMTWLTALLPVKEGVAVLATLTRASDSARASGDPRSKGQVMADTLVSSVLGRQPATDGRTPAVPVSLGLVMSDAALLGTSDEPAHLDGYGPVPAELAREIVCDALTRDEQVWVRRLWTSPTTGELVSMDSHQRIFPTALGRFVRLRDRVCRTPWCDAPIRHTDHPEEHARGGPTSARNSQGLCEACNYAKQAHGWRARPAPDDPGATSSRPPSRPVTPTGPGRRPSPRSRGQRRRPCASTTCSPAEPIATGRPCTPGRSRTSAASATIEPCPTVTTRTSSAAPATETSSSSATTCGAASTWTSSTPS